MTAPQKNRRLSVGLVFVSGLASGVLIYLVAEWLTPKNVASSGDHDILLANRLGFIYTPFVGLWLGWLQKSWKRAAVGAIVGIAIGLVYMWLCASRNFPAVMVGLPCLLGGAVAAIVGSNHSPWLRGLGARLGKGLLAGLVLGFVYMVILNVLGAMLMPPQTEDETKSYIKMMWRDGPVALGISSGLFLVLIKWAVGLSRVRFLVFEDEEPSKQTGKSRAEQHSKP